MSSNPFLLLAQMMESDDPSDGVQVVEGTVTSLSPVTVTAFGVAFSGTMLKINPQLLDTWEPEVELETDDITYEGVLTVTKGALEVGDTVFCIADGGRCLYALTKVV